MARCSAHRIEKPCFYCERGVPAFQTTDDWLKALEARVLELESNKQTLVNLDIRHTNLVVRMGGVGDLVILSSSLKALKEKYPHRSLILATKPENMAILAGVPFLDGIIPIDSWGEAQVKNRFDLRYKVEPKGIGSGCLPMADYTSMDRSDIFDQLLGVTSKKEFTVPLDDMALEKMGAQMSGWKDKLIIGLNPTCKSPLRTMPPEYVEPLVQKITQNLDATVVLFGKTEGWNQHLATLRARHLVNFIDQITLPELITAVSLMDVVIAPDSAVTHIAGALKIPCLGLFGNIHPKTRITYYPTVKALFPAGELPCIPCWDMPGACKRPKNEFGAKCMRLLTPERIAGELFSMIQAMEKAA